MDLYESLIKVIENAKSKHENGYMSDIEYKSHAAITTKKINILKDHNKLTNEQAESLIGIM